MDHHFLYQDIKPAILAASKPLFWLCVLLLTALILSIHISPMTNNDIWIHLKNGELILKNKAFLYTDTYSFRTLGMPWVNHEWLAGVIFYLVYLMGGVNGLIFFKAFIFVVLALILLRICVITRQEFALFFPLLVFAQYMIAFRSLVRPHILTYLLIIIYIYILFAYKYHRRDLLWLIPILHLFWVNTHGGWFVGSMILCIFVVGETCRLIANQYTRFGQKDLISWPGQKKLYLIFLMTIILIMVNPEGYKMYTYPFELTTKHTFMSDILEWQPPFESPNFRTTYAFVYYIAWIVLLGISFFLAYRHFDLTNFAICLLFFYMSYRMQRNVGSFALATMPIMGLNYSRALQGVSYLKQIALPRIDAWLKSIFLILLLILVYHGFTFGYRFSSVQGKPFGLGIGSNMPTKAVAYAKENRLRGNCFNSYTYGGIIIFELYPETRVVMDSRDLPYGEELYLEHQNAMANVQVFEQMDKRYHFDYLMLYHRNKNLIHHFQFLKKNKHQWAMIYFDDRSIIYVRRTPAFADLIKRDEYHCLHPVLIFQKDTVNRKNAECFRKEAWKNLKRDHTIQSTRLLWQNLSLRLKRYDQALTEAKELVAIWPDDYHTYCFLGLLYLTKKDKAQARTMLEMALSINPSDKNAQKLLKDAFPDEKSSE